MFHIVNSTQDNFCASVDIRSMLCLQLLLGLLLSLDLIHLLMPASRQAPGFFCICLLSTGIAGALLPWSWYFFFFFPYFLIDSSRISHHAPQSHSFSSPSPFALLTCILSNTGSGIKFRFSCLLASTLLPISSFQPPNIMAQWPIICICLLTME